MPPHTPTLTHPLILYTHSNTPDIVSNPPSKTLLKTPLTHLPPPLQPTLPPSRRPRTYLHHGMQRRQFDGMSVVRRCLRVNVAGGDKIRCVCVTTRSIITHHLITLPLITYPPHNPLSHNPPQNLLSRDVHSHNKVNHNSHPHDIPCHNPPL